MKCGSSEFYEELGIHYNFHQDRQILMITLRKGLYAFPRACRASLAKHSYLSHWTRTA